MTGNTNNRAAPSVSARELKDSRPLFVMGDVHGEYEKLLGHLRGAALIDTEGRWIGADARLWFMGDFVDRGKHGIEVLELVMRLQDEAHAVGGEIGAILGNHDAIFAAVWRFGKTDMANVFRASWLINGGLVRDMESVDEGHIAWLCSLPAMARVGRYLLIHADSLLYTQFGKTMQAVNAGIHEVLHSDDSHAWESLLDQFSDRMAFMPRHPEGTDRAVWMLETYGGEQIVHGHTPIHYALGMQDPRKVTEPLLYGKRNGQALCLNVDGGMYAGGSGFLVKLE